MTESSVPRPRPSKPRRPRGSVYQRGRIFWIQYYVPGEATPRRESARTESPREAQNLLSLRLGKIAEGKPILRRMDLITYDELAADLRLHFQTTGCRALKEADTRFAHLGRFFAGRRAATIGQPQATAYAAHRQAEGAANGTINRELAILGRLLRLGYEANKVARPPAIGLLKEAPPRQGFFEDAQYAAVRSHLPPDLQVVIDLDHTFGWRTQSEVLALERRQLDLTARPHGTLRLDGGTTKNDDGRVVYLTPELQQAPCRAIRAGPEAGAPAQPSHSVSVPAPRGPVEGDPPKRLLQTLDEGHDHGRLSGPASARLPGNRGAEPRERRRPRAGGDDDHGHKTRSVFDRYHIVSPADLQDASARLALAARHNFRHNPPPRQAGVR
jgi:hypothetical protein